MDKTEPNPHLLRLVTTGETAPLVRLRQLAAILTNSELGEVTAMLLGAPEPETPCSWKRTKEELIGQANRLRTLSKELTQAEMGVVAALYLRELSTQDLGEVIKGLLRE